MALSSYAGAHPSVKTRLDRSFNASFLISFLTSLAGAFAGALVISQVGDPNSWLIGSAAGAALVFGAGLIRRVVALAHRRP